MYVYIYIFKLVLLSSRTGQKHIKIQQEKNTEQYVLGFSELCYLFTHLVV